jgi:opacity protein-like surface antigen
LGDAFDFAYGLSGGVKFYPYEHVGIHCAVSYQQLQGAENFIDDVDATAFNVGVAVRF